MLDVLFFLQNWIFLPYTRIWTGLYCPMPSERLPSPSEWSTSIYGRLWSESKYSKKCWNLLWFFVIYRTPNTLSSIEIFAVKSLTSDVELSKHKQRDRIIVQGFSRDSLYVAFSNDTHFMQYASTFEISILYLYRPQRIYSYIYILYTFT